jgi:hypothetical protein
MHFFVGLREGIVCLILQTLFKAEMGDGVIHQLVDQVAYFLAGMAFVARVIQLIDVLNDAAVLLVNHLDANVKLISPYELGHLLPSPNVKCLSAENRPNSID